jgi:MFS family permease
MVAVAEPAQVEAATPLGRDPAFVRLWAAESVSKMGDAVGVVAMPLIAILALGAGPTELAALGAAQVLPILLLGLPAGAWVDGRPRKRPLMVAADVARAAVTASVPIAWALGGLTFVHLWLALLVNAALGTVYDVGFAAYIPRMVGRSRLVAANARLEGSRSAAQVLGPGFAGLLLSFLTAPLVLFVDALSFLASAAFLSTTRTSEPVPESMPPEAESGQRAPTRRETLLAGVAFIRREPHLRAITATAMTNNLSRSIAMVVLLLFLVREAGIPADRVAFGFALGNSGFVAGALVASPAARRLGIGRAMTWAVSLFGPGMLLVAAAPVELAFPAFVAMLFLNGFGIAVHNVNQVSVRQAVTPDELRARVAAASRVLILGALPVGTIIGGVLGEFVGLRGTLWVAAAGLFLGALPYRITRVGRLRELPQLAQG